MWTVGLVSFNGSMVSPSTAASLMVVLPGPGDFDADGDGIVSMSPAAAVSEAAFGVTLAVEGGDEAANCTFAIGRKNKREGKKNNKFTVETKKGGDEQQL